MSPEKVAVLRALNATIIRTPTQAAWDSPESHIGVARRLQKELPNAHILDQYGNTNNPLAHEYGTAEEIWTQTDGKIKMVVAGAGTGGTITGLARGLRKHNRDVKVVAADPHGSILAVPQTLNTQHANESYKVEGIGYDFVPDVLDQAAVNQWYKTDDRESFMYARRLIAEEGLLVGGSSGSAIAAMVRAVKDAGLGKDDVVVVILPDSIRSYLSKVSPPSLLENHPPLTTPHIVRRRRLACSQRPPPPNSTSNQPTLPNSHTLSPPPFFSLPIRRQISLRQCHNPHPPPQTHHHRHHRHLLRRRNRNHARQRLRPTPSPRLSLRRTKLETSCRAGHPGEPTLLDQPRARQPFVASGGRHVLLLQVERSGHESDRYRTYRDINQDAQP